MYLQKYISVNEKKFEMTGFFDSESIPKNKLVRFGYITLTPNKKNDYLKTSVKAHEFHYWDSTDNGNTAKALRLNGKSWDCISYRKNVFAGYPHIYYYSNIEFARNFVNKCRKILITVMGGSGSGKSEFAEDEAVKLHKKYGGKLYYIATMKPYDDESIKRIQRHREMRKDKGFLTIECYDNIKHLNIEYDSIVLLECMSNLLANEMFYNNNKNLSDIIEGINNIKKCKAVVIVTNDIFSDGVHYKGDMAQYIKMLSDINSYLYKISDNAIEVVYSIPIYHKGSADND